MNKIQVGGAPSPNLKAIKSKIGSLNNATYKPGGGHIKIETKKLDFNKTAPKIEAKNDKYAPKGGDKKASIVIMTVVFVLYNVMANSLTVFGVDKSINEPHPNDIFVGFLYKF